MVRVLSETLLSREWRSRARSAVVRPAAGAGGGRWNRLLELG